MFSERELKKKKKKKEWLTHRNVIVACLKLYVLFADFCGYDTSGAQKVKHILHWE